MLKREINQLKDNIKMGFKEVNCEDRKMIEEADTDRRDLSVFLL
jgi:hypothetical protein